MFLKILHYSQENICVVVSPPVNIAKFLRIVFLQNNSEQLLDLLIDFIIMKHFLKIILFSNLGATDMKTWGILVTIFQMETCTTWKQNCVSLTSQLKLKKFVRHGHRHWLRQRRLNFVVKRHITVGIFQLIKFELTDNWKIIW